MWSSLVDMSKDDCRKALRTLELETYGSMVSVLRAQGHFSPEKKKLLSEVATALCIPVERHKAEIRKAVNDDVLNFIADKLVGPNTGTEWAIEGRRLFPPFPKPPQCTAFASIADEAADYISGEHESFASASEAAQKAADFPFSNEPSSPEPSKTQVQSSDSGLLVLPSGAAIQMKRESEDEDGERKKKRAPVADLSQQNISPSSPPPKIMIGSQGQQIPMSSRTMPFPPGSGPMKIALPGARTPTTSMQTLSSNAKQVIIVSSSGTQNPPSILQKTLSVPMKTSAMKPNVLYSPNTSANVSDAFKPRAKQPITSTPIAKPRPNAIVVSQKPPLKASATPTKHGMPMHTKIVVQQKAMGRGVQKPQHVMVQQKPGKQPLVTNVQLKTNQGFTSVPVQLRAATKPQGMQMKQDTGGQMKMLSLAGGTKILPKPSQPLYVVTASTTPLTMVTRTVPASCPPRVMTVPTGNQAMKWNQSPGGGKTMQTLHVMAPQRRHDNVVLFQKGPAGKVPQVTKEGSISKGLTKTSQKPLTAISTSALAQSLQQLPPQAQTGANVILLDLGNSEKVSNPMLADILQASGILTGDDGKAMTIDLGSSGEDIEEIEEPEKKKDTGSKEAPTTIGTMSIEQAVEMLNQSDTPETRAILSQAGIQISDEIADSEEEEQVLDSSQISEQVTKHTEPENEIIDLKEEVIDVKEESIDESTSQDSTATSETIKTSEPSPSLSVSTMVSIPSTVHSIYSRPRSLDIFTTALASANINLDSFMEEEDDPEPSVEDKGDGKSGIVMTEDAARIAADSSTDPLDVQLAALTGEMGQ